ncbi:hypothetical protein ACLOJK_032683 [Asimina triloba]
MSTNQTAYLRMGQDITEAKKVLKVHRVMCEELKRVVNRITEIIPSIESARPGCNSGIQALCALSLAVDKANLQLKNCTESSKLYLAIRGESIQLTFEKLSKELDICLSKIQDMVPQPLAAEISDVINDLRDSKFEVDSSEKEAGRILISLLEQDKPATDSTGISEFEAFQIAALLLKIKSRRSILIERRSIKKLLNKVNDTESRNKKQLGKVSDRENRKKNVLKNLLHLLRKYENLLGCEPSEAVLSQQISSASITASECNSCHPDQPQLQLHVGSALGEAPNKECSSDGPPEELMCPISLELMFDPVVIASGVTYERIWIEKWFAEGHDTCPKTLIKLPHLSLTPNSCVKELIANWCRKHNYTVPDPCSEPVPASSTHDTTFCCTSNNNIGSSPENLEDRAFYGEKSGNCASENDISSTLTSWSDGSKILDLSVTGTTKSFQDGPSKISSWTWSDNSERCPSLEDLNREKYSNFLSELETLPSESHCKALEDVKIVLKRNEEASYSANSEAFVQAILAFLMNARDCSDNKAQKIGAQILLTFLSYSRIKMPSLNEDAFLLLASFLESEIFEEALAIMQILSSHDYCKFEIMASGVLPSIIKVLDSQVKEFLLQAVEILCNLSSYSSIKSYIVSTGCISKLIPLLGNAELAEICSRILRNLCDEGEEARVAIAETNGCIASLIELIDTGTREDQENAVSVLLSLCSNSSKCCHLVMNEGGIPPLITLSINGSSEGEEKARKLLLLLRDLKNIDSVQSSSSQAGFDPELPQEAGGLCQEKKPTSLVSTFFKKIKHFLQEQIFSPKRESNDRSKASARKQNCRA